MRIFRWLVPAMVVLAGCGAGGKPSGPITPPQPAVLHVSIIKGDVKPRAARVELRVGQSLILVVRSDATEEIHVHSDPEREFEVKPGATRRFSFTVNRPGKVAVEVHKLDVVIAEVLVRQ